MNGQVKHVDGMVLQGLKPRIFNQLNKFGRRWVMEVPTVLWSLRMTLQPGHQLHTILHDLWF